MSSFSFVKALLMFFGILALMIGVNLLLLFLSSKITNNDPKRKHLIKFIVYLDYGLIVLYLLTNLISFFSKIWDDYKGNYLHQNIIVERVLIIGCLAFYFIFKIIQFNVTKTPLKNYHPYKLANNDNGEQYYYIDLKNKSLGKMLQKTALVMAIIFSLCETIFVYNNILYFSPKIEFIFNYGYIICISFIYLIVNDIGLFLDGDLKLETDDKHLVVNNSDNFNTMLAEYIKVFKKHLLLCFDKNDDVKNNQVTDTESYIYGKILTPIASGNNIIIETEQLYLLNDIVPPIINLLFGTNRKMLFITENDSESIATYNWLRKCDVVTENSRLVVQVYTEDNDNIISSDSNVDIYIGTIDLLLEHRDVTKLADTVFSINIDNIIVDSPISLGILAKILANNRKRKTQYILFSNQVNGLNQSIENVFMNSDFEYQVVRQRNTKNFHALLFAKDKGWLQKEILPAVAQNALGAVLPLLVTPIKYGFDSLHAFSSLEPYRDEKKALQKFAPNLKSYTNNSEVLDITDKIEFLQNEHFAENMDNMVISYDDAENNLVLILNNYIKYSTSRVLVNIVSDKYLLRDYMVDNIDFFMQNNVFLGKIVPYYKEGKKLNLFKLVYELTLHDFNETNLVEELERISNHSFGAMGICNPEKFIRDEITELIKEVFGRDVYIEAYLNRKLEQETNRKVIYNYSLSPSIFDELPKSLFLNIRFLATDQRYKILKKIPLYEMYQNYAQGQYVVFDGKSYLIDKLDDVHGAVNMIYNDSIVNRTYRHKKDIEIDRINALVDGQDSVNVQGIEYTKNKLEVDARVFYSGYYEFTNGINFGENFQYKRNNKSENIPSNTYINQKAYMITLKSDVINELGVVQRIKVNMTLAFLFNELFYTIYHGCNQYMILRPMFDESTYSNLDFNDDVINLYSPICYGKEDDGSIKLFVMEDTELEKGILDSFTIKLDTTIIPTLIDYLGWILDGNRTAGAVDTNDSGDIYSVQLETDNHERIDICHIDREDFLKLGSKSINTYFDIKTTFDILKSLDTRGNDGLTIMRKAYIANRLFAQKVEENNDNTDQSKADEKDEQNIEKENEQRNEQKDEQNNSKYEYIVDKDVKKKDVVEYLEKNIYDPVINTEKDIGALRQTAQTAKQRINEQNWNVNSVVNYVLHSIESERGKSIYKKLKEFDLPCFEDYADEFKSKFGIQKQ